MTKSELQALIAEQSNEALVQSISTIKDDLTQFSDKNGTVHLAGAIAYCLSSCSKITAMTLERVLPDVLKLDD